MNWKAFAVDRLKRYEAMKASLTTIPDEIKRLEQEFERIRSARTDGTPISGAYNRRDEDLVNNIVSRQELAANLDDALAWIAVTDAAFSALDVTDQMILDRFYITREKGAATRLAGELWLDEKTVYRRKDEALYRFTLALYGVTET